MWLDSQHHKYVEEIGAMNVFLVKNGIAYTCPLNGSILPGITRKSSIELLKDNGIEETNCILNKGTPNEGKVGPITQKLFDLIVGIQRGIVEDTKGWITYVE
ncbi:putative branched-chain amino acid aminotransferase [Blattamonas nauphoetae]|uniref:Branched-chain-amino-acid aminotransferase n=1 Tax=Blattamonas nauphoetae TaxID=2049346 RepID=A0ABQ9Y6Y3_9EUKA|nr:putative branched-chain amino acid aminotransferase [Blattamonas nauphoetae]